MARTDDDPELSQRDAAYRALQHKKLELMAANLEEQRRFNTDVRTGVNNRRRFDEYISIEWRRARREQAPLALLLADVDYFKRYNETYGVPAGDAVLKNVAGAFSRCCQRPADLVALYDAEVFALVLPGTRANGAHIVGERMRETVLGLEVEHSASSVGRYLSISVGGAVAIPADADGLLELIAAAEGNLEDAKKGHNRVVVRE